MDMHRQYALAVLPEVFLFVLPGDVRGQNEHELADVLLSGWAVDILEENEDGWCKVRTFYGYEGWIFGKNLQKITAEELKRRQDKAVFRSIRSSAADILSEPKVQGVIRETVLQSSIVEYLARDDSSSWVRIRTASGAEGWVFGAALRERKDDDRFLLTGEPDSFRLLADQVLEKNEEEKLRQGIIDSALTYLGSPYRWGGKSPLGIDCSGLAFMCILEQGILIYRDARIQEGYPVREIPREELQRGDLIFFPGHVAVFMGEGRYIHATGFAGTPHVTINSLSPDDPDYRADLADKITSCGSVF